MKNNDLEYSMSQEYIPLPDEYLQKTENVTEYKEKEKKASWKKMMFMTIAFATIISASFTQKAVPSEESGGLKNEADINTALTETSDNKQQTQTDDTSKYTGVAELPTLPVYPVEDSTSFLTVYNDSFNTDIGENKVLMQNFVFDSTISSGMDVAMPEYEPQEGFIFMGWVVYYNKDFESGPAIGMLNNALTLYDFCYIKPDENGSRNIEVHAAWRHDGIGEWPNLLTLDANGGTIENETVVTYDANGPMYSASCAYLCAYPIPERDGYTFAGWYADPDCSGKQITMLQAASFFETATNEDGRVYVDFEKRKPVTLYAGWVKK